MLTGTLPHYQYISSSPDEELVKLNLGMIPGNDHHQVRFLMFISVHNGLKRSHFGSMRTKPTKFTHFRICLLKGIGISTKFISRKSELIVENRIWRLQTPSNLFCSKVLIHLFWTIFNLPKIGWERKYELLKR